MHIVQVNSVKKQNDQHHSLPKFLDEYLFFSSADRYHYNRL